MTLDDLRVFVAVCRTGNLSAVARDLSCTQSAVSQHVRRLERELGLSLLERHPRGVAPTAAGRILHEAACDGIGGIDLALRRLRDLARGDGGSVRITTGATTVRHFMSEAVVAFRQRFPQVSLEFQTETSSRSCFDALAANDLDLAWITIGAAVRGIEQRPVVELPWVLAVKADDPLAAKNRIEPADLASVQLIRLPENSTSRAHLDTCFAELGIQLASDTSVADWDTAILLAELGLGHAVVPALPGWSGPSHPGLRLIPIPVLPALSAGWAVRRWDALSPLARTFADTVAHNCTPWPTGAALGASPCTAAQVTEPVRNREAPAAPPRLA
ncbi:LysR family transcriptional regulator [Streptomyces sp. SID13666]|uniref:LysR substrate-binding domain-containing protein n=1 Tax=unclassified Streptomyces TaxID=2593676 RepID=UPI0013C183BA|nr:LysR family transcriptional regulator [Streptomyces sp. SID13666]NEA70419.1 LysR family transcriptional regulator [Streptomyces sp. SID13588]